MPKRSNDFQKLVFTVKKHVADTATVTESKLLRDRITGASREVDVVIEMGVAGHPVVLSVECRDHRRPAAVGWVEEMRTKHDRLPTNRLVLVSRSGFTPEAEQVAAAYNIELLRFSEATDARVSALLSGSNSLWGKTFQLSATRVVIHVGQTGDLPAEDVAAFPDNLVFSSQGKSIGTVRELVENFLRSEEIIKRLGRDGDESHKWFEIEWGVPHDDDADALYLEKIEPCALRKIERIRFMGDCAFTISEFRLRRGHLGSVEVAWGRGSLLGQDAALFASRSDDGTAKLTLAFDKGPSAAEGQARGCSSK